MQVPYTAKRWVAAIFNPARCTSLPVFALVVAACGIGALLGINVNAFRMPWPFLYLLATAPGALAGACYGVWRGYNIIPLAWVGTTMELLFYVGTLLVGSESRVWSWEGILSIGSATGIYYGVLFHVFFRWHTELKNDLENREPDG